MTVAIADTVGGTAASRTTLRILPIAESRVELNPLRAEATFHSVVPVIIKSMARGKMSGRRVS